MTVDNFIHLAKSGFYNGLAFVRVVPNFVVQAGDPRGDQNGGPGYQIRDEINLRRYETGTVGMALSGKDTGGSQFFITHSPQPHLDGGYTIFGRVIEGMDAVNRIARGDKIERVEIIGPK
jgi:cyclophilin family peptidyl-prolyl cis-trans isomerase